MRPIHLMVLAGTMCLLGVTVGRAQDDLMLHGDYLYQEHLQQVNQALNHSESSQSVNAPVYRANMLTNAVSNILGNPVNKSSIVPKKDEIAVSSEVYNTRFKEPGNMSQEGFMTGINAQYSHRMSNDPKSIINMYSVQGQWAEGKVNGDTSEGGLTGIHDKNFEVRGVVGKDLYPSSFLRTTGYLGLGYRYWDDNSQGLSAPYEQFIVSGYDRRTNYWYMPFGADVMFQNDPYYSLEGDVEYDCLLYGWETNKLGIFPGYNTLVFDQPKGDGFRASLRLNIYFRDFTAFLEGFYRYWGIAQSKGKSDPTNPTAILSEPANTTQEFGLRAGVQI